MAAVTLETIQIGRGEKHYVTTKAAAKYLHISHDRLKVLIVLGKIEASTIEARVFIELDTLMSFDVSKYPARRGR